MTSPFNLTAACGNHACIAYGQPVKPPPAPSSSWSCTSLEDGSSTRSLMRVQRPCRQCGWNLISIDPISLEPIE